MSKTNKMKNTQNTPNEFQPILMHTNENAIKSTLKNAEELAAKWNNVLKEAQALLKRNLTDNEKVEILEDRMDEVMTQLRNDFQFKNASDEFNIEALGINLKPIKDAFKQCMGRYDNDILEVKNGVVQVSEEGKARIEESAKLYTKTQHQNKVYEMAQKLSQNLNEALDMKILHLSSNPLLERAFDIVTMPMGSNIYKPNYQRIKNM